MTAGPLRPFLASNPFSLSLATVGCSEPGLDPCALLSGKKISGPDVAVSPARAASSRLQGLTGSTNPPDQVAGAPGGG